MSAFQAEDEGPTPSTRSIYFERSEKLQERSINVSPRGEMDITSVFGTDVIGSNPIEGTMVVVVKWYHRRLWLSYHGFDSRRSPHLLRTK